VELLEPSSLLLPEPQLPVPLDFPVLELLSAALDVEPEEVFFEQAGVRQSAAPTAARTARR